MSPDTQPSAPRNPFEMGFYVWLATGGWIGFIPFAPGTFGTLLGIPLAVAISGSPLWLELTVIVVVCGLGVPVCTQAARTLGGKKDPQSIVLDEIASLAITFFRIPLDFSGSSNMGFKVLVAGFLLHRLFDITKPPPARQLERLPEGLGIMADDWAAGLYSNLAPCALLAINPWSFFSP